MDNLQYPSNIPTGKVGLGSGFAHVYFDDFLLNNGKTVLQRMDYTYDKEGKRTQSKDKDNNTVAYAYDNMHHLSSETGPGYHKEYQYDLAGNRERLISGTHTTYYYYNSFNQLTARNWAGYADMLDIKNYHYDDNGNMYAGSNSDDNSVKQMGWNPYGEMTYFQKWVNTVLVLDSYYYYDPYSHRYQRDYWSPEYPQRLTQNQYYYDGNNVIQEREIYQGATVSNTYYHSLPSSLNRVISIRKGGIDYWYHTDPIGNVLFISDSTGSIIATYNQEAFGNIISSTGYADNDLHLHERGQEDGYVDLYYFGARWYDPELGRWLSPEPLGLDGPNLYQFVWNNPVQYFDSNGLYAYGVHYTLTYKLARETGFGKRSSKALAEYDQGVDDYTPPYPWENSENWELHFDTRENARKRLCDAIKRSDWAAFGKALHTFQDTYSHAGYSWPLGHLKDGHTPDYYLPESSARDREMGDETRKYLNLYLKQLRINKNNPNFIYQ